MASLKPAVILFAHGARDARWAEPLQLIAQEIRRLDPELRVDLAFLEFMSPTLPELTKTLSEAGFNNARLLPVFLGGAGHVLRDLPGLIESCTSACPGLSIVELKPVGQQLPVIAAIASIAADPGSS